MERILRDVQSTLMYSDDVVITGKMQEDHLKNFDLILSRLENEDLSLRREKCSYSMLSSVKYLGHVISSDDLQPSEGKILVITDSPTTSEYCPIKVILRIDKLLLQFHEALIQLASTAVLIFATEDALALGQGRENSLQSSVETVVITGP